MPFIIADKQKGEWKVEKKIKPVLKNQIYSVEITSLGHSGEGVAKYQGFTIFVPYALPGETVEVKITEVKKSYAKATL